MLKKGGDTEVETVVKKPEYMPKTIKPVKMTKCKVAPALGGIRCNEWYSFTFLTEENFEIVFSTRSGKKFSKELSLTYCTFKMGELTFKGNVTENSISFQDTLTIDGAEHSVLHKYKFIE